MPKDGQEEKGFAGFVRSDLELVAWVLAGFVIGVTLELITASAIIIAVVVIAAIVRLSVEGEERNSRPSIGMVPLFLLGWTLGLLLRALIS